MKPTDSEIGLTGSILEGLLSYEPETGKFRHVRGLGGAGAGAEAGFLRKDGYVQLKIKKRPVLAHRLAWVWMHGVWPKAEIDHLNGDKSDNRIANLRLADRSLNTFHVGLRKSNSSGRTGVHFKVLKDKYPVWFAVIRENGKQTFLGYRKTFEEAVADREAAELRIYGAKAPRRRCK